MDNVFSSPAAYVGTTGNEKIVQNIGAKRIQGNELVARGKVPQFLYYIVDIKALAVFENQGADVWIGAFGQPVAGSAAIRDSIPAFEGQRFYVIDQDTSFEYKNGSWTGTVFEGNVQSPTYIELDGTKLQLERGLKYRIGTAGAYVLPKLDATATGEGRSLNGHAIEIVVNFGIAATLNAYDGTEQFVANGANRNSINLLAEQHYVIVHDGTKWNVFAIDVEGIQNSLDTKMDKAANLSDVADPATARTNLDVFDKAASTAMAEGKVDGQTAGAGVNKTGNAADGNIVWFLDFATPQEVQEGTVNNKPITPADITDAVTNATRSSEFNNITGLLPKTTEAKFNLVTNADRTKVDYTEFTVVFNSDPYIRTSQLVSLTVIAGQITLPNTAGIVTHRVVVNNMGVVSLSPTRPDPTSTTEIMLGTIIAINGEVLSLGGQDQILVTPWLASSDYAVRHNTTTIDGGKVAASATAGKVSKAAITINQESSNWEASTTSPHKTVLPPSDPLVFATMDRNGAFVNPSTDEINGELLDTGASVGNNNYSIQIAYQATETVVVVLLGQQTYASYNDAVAAIQVYAPIIPTPLATALEFSRWVIKGDQHAGSGSLDLGVANNFSTFSGMAVISGGSSASSASEIISSNTQNTLATTNLQEQVNELSSRTDWEFHTGGGTLVDENAIVTDGTNVTLPPLPQTGIQQRIMAIGGNA